MTVVTGDRLAYRPARSGFGAPQRLRSSFARSRRVLRASIQAASAYESARTNAARRVALDRFQAQLGR
jgi:hypothetical protein